MDGGKQRLGERMEADACHLPPQDCFPRTPFDRAEVGSYQAFVICLLFVREKPDARLPRGGRVWLWKVGYHYAYPALFAEPGSAADAPGFAATIRRSRQSVSHHHFVHILHSRCVYRCSSSRIPALGQVTTCRPTLEL